MNDALKNLPRLSDQAMGPCVRCERQLLATGAPLFYRVRIQHCGIDGEEVRKHVGLAMAMGGGRGGLALASVLGPKVEPVVVMSTFTEANICHDCAMAPGFSFPELIGRVMPE